MAYLRDVSLGHSQVPIEQTPEEPGTHRPGKVLTEPKQQFHDQREEQPDQHDGLPSKYVRRPAPSETADEVAKEEGTAKVTSLLAWRHRGETSIQLWPIFIKM